MRNRTRNLEPKNVERVRRLRTNMSISEKTPWRILKARRIGFQFKRQYPVGPYALDFYCPEARLCLEVDGEQHFLTTDRDERRDDWLLAEGIETIRIPSLDLFEWEAPRLTRWIVCIQEACEAGAGRAADAKRRATCSG